MLVLQRSTAGADFNELGDSQAGQGWDAPANWGVSSAPVAPTSCSYPGSYAIPCPAEGKPSF
jgi:hypothetical protein